MCDMAAIRRRRQPAPPVGAMIAGVETAEVPQEVARLRRQFADRIVAPGEAAWGDASWRSGWQVRDVLAHLVRNAESTPWSLMGDLLRGGLRPDHSMTKAAKQLRGVPVPALADRLGRAADDRLRSGSSSNPFGMGDVLVHSADAFRPFGLDVDVAPDAAAAVLDAYWDRVWLVVRAALTVGTAWWRQTSTGPGEVERRYEGGPSTSFSSSPTGAKFSRSSKGRVSGPGIERTFRSISTPQVGRCHRPR
jgi:hypothetical protein